MKRVLSCPVDPPEKCKFIELSFIGRGEENAAVNLIKRSFPHMKIDSWWYGKIKSGDTIVVKRDGKKMIGIANLSYGNGANLNLLAVDPGYRGMGMGTMLLEEAEDLASKNGEREIKLMTEQAKPENVVFYSSHGYKVSGFDKNGYEHCPGIFLKKQIKVQDATNTIDGL